MITSRGILYIEPSDQISSTPVIDELTKRMTAAFRRASPGMGYRGFHICSCGATSSNCDYLLPNGEWTNSLCIHYLVWHRDEVPADELAKVQLLDYGQEEPIDQELF